MQKLAASLATLSIVALLCAATAVAGDEEASPIPSSTKQLLVVRAPAWSSTAGTLTRFERASGGAWQAVGVPFSVNLGRNGMAWGRGLQSRAEGGPVKKEGDQKSPAGAFDLGPAFGYREDLPEGAKRYPYVHIRRGISCIEDKKSIFYNRVIDPAAVTHADWSARDEMLRPDGLFRLGVVVEHNMKDTVPGAGSCIFLHIWRGPAKGTAGCTAMPAEAIEETIRWLDPDRRPVLIQLPEGEYARLRAAWVLP